MGALSYSYYVIIGTSISKFIDLISAYYIILFADVSTEIYFSYVIKQYLYKYPLVYSLMA